MYDYTNLPNTNCNIQETPQPFCTTNSSICGTNTFQADAASSQRFINLAKPDTYELESIKIKEGIIYMHHVYFIACSKF